MGLRVAVVDRRAQELLSGVPAAWRVGREANFLSNVPFETMWELPLEEVRRQFGIRALGCEYPVGARHPDAPWGPEYC